METRLALIGTGRWGSVLQRNITDLPDVVLAYTVTREWEMLLDKDDIDGVIIATPPSTHAAIALPFIERGIPVFIEKPVTLSSSEAARITAASRASGTPVMVGHIHLYNPAFTAFKESIAVCGSPLLLIGEGGNFGPFRTDYSVLWDWAPHDISMMLDILGEDPATVSAWGAAVRASGNGLWDMTRLKLTFPQGAIGFIESSWLLPEKRKRMTVIGSAGTAVYDDVRPDQKVTLYRDTEAGREHSFPEYAATTPLTIELRTFLEAIKNRAAPTSDAVFGERVVRILDAAERSITEDGRPQVL